MNKMAHKTIIDSQKKIHDRLFPKLPPNKENTTEACGGWKCDLCGKVNWQKLTNCGYCNRLR